MKRLFVFNCKKECSTLMVLSAKIVKIIHIVLACVSALFFLIAGIQLAENSVLFLLLYLIIGAISFFLILFQGFLIEILLLGFSIIIKNHYEELIEKGKIEDEPLKKEKKNFDVIDKLNNLNELKNLGIITEEEFNQKKKEILKGF